MQGGLSGADTAAPVPEWHRRYGAFATALLLYVILGGLVSLLGWVLDVPRLADWDNDDIFIQPNAAVAAIASGLAVWLLLRSRPRAARVLGGLVAVIGAATIFEYLSGLNLGIDTLLMFDRTWGRTGVLSPGRMGPPGSTSWMVLGLGICVASHPRGRRLAASIALLPAGLASLGLIG